MHIFSYTVSHRRVIVLFPYFLLSLSPRLLPRIVPHIANRNQPSYAGNVFKNDTSTHDQKNSLIGRAGSHVAWPGDFQQIPGWDKFWLHKSCTQLNAAHRKRVFEAFEYGKELIDRGYDFAKQITNAWDKNEPDTGPCAGKNNLQKWIRDLCPPFELLFSEGRVKQKVHLTQWLNGWQKMNQLVSPGKNLKPVLASCFKTFDSRKWPDSEGDYCAGRYALTVYRAQLVSPSLKQPDYNFADPDVKEYEVVNFCPEFFDTKGTERPQLKTQEELIAVAKTERLGRFDLSLSTVDVLVHELGHLKGTFFAPEWDKNGLMLEASNDIDIRKLSSKDGLGLLRTWNLAEQNAQFAGWSWWYERMGWRYMSWDGGEHDEQMEKQLGEIEKSECVIC